MKNIIKPVNATNQNFVFSPVAVYHALALLAQTTAGESKKEILKALNLKEEELSQKTQELYMNFNINSVGDGRLMLNSSLWLNKNLNSNEEKCKEIADSANCAIRKVNMGTSSADKQIQRWVNVNTGNLLKDSVSNIKTKTDQLFALFSAIYLKGNWVRHFNEKGTKKKDFYVTKDHKEKCLFMNQLNEDDLLVGKRFTAIKMFLNGIGCCMYFILPNEGYTPNDISNDEDLLNLLEGDESKLEKKYYNLHISIPKFDIKASEDLIKQIKKIGVQKVFDMNQADFSPISNEEKIYIDSANQAARLKINEDGVEAAAYVEFSVCLGMGMLFEKPKEYDFVLDKPFMFSVVKGDTPLFVGTVANPNE